MSEQFDFDASDLEESQQNSNQIQQQEDSASGLGKRSFQELQDQNNERGDANFDFDQEMNSGKRKQDSAKVNEDENFPDFDDDEQDEEVSEAAAKRQKTSEHAPEDGG